MKKQTQHALPPWGCAFTVLPDLNQSPFKPSKPIIMVISIKKHQMLWLKLLRLHRRWSDPISLKKTHGNQPSDVILAPRSLRLSSRLFTMTKCVLCGRLDTEKRWGAGRWGWGAKVSKRHEAFIPSPFCAALHFVSQFVELAKSLHHPFLRVGFGKGSLVSRALQEWQCVCRP